MFTAKLREAWRNVLYWLPLSHASYSLTNISYQNATFVTTDEPTLPHNYLKSIVYNRIHSWLFIATRLNKSIITRIHDCTVIQNVFLETIYSHCTCKWSMMVEEEARKIYLLSPSFHWYKFPYETSTSKTSGLHMYGCQVGAEPSHATVVLGIHGGSQEPLNLGYEQTGVIRSCL